MDLKDEDTKKCATILDFRDAYIKKFSQPKFMSLMERIHNIRHSERAEQQLKEQLKCKK